MAIQVRGLGKTFANGAAALQDIDLEVAPGTLFGLLGPNGAGKTTMVRVLNGVLTASAGSARIFGHDVATDSIAIHRICGVMTETAAPYENLTGAENLELFGGLHGLARAEVVARSDELLRALDLAEHRAKQVKHYSTGMKRRLLIARALLHRPQVLYLDEPTSGLDPEAALQVNQLLGQLARRDGVTVLLCTHQLKYAESLCTHFGFLDRGRLLATGTLAELLLQHQEAPVLDLRGPNLHTYAEALGGTWQDHDRLSLPVQSETEVPAVLRRLLGDGAEVYEARLRQWSLEDLYFAVVAKQHPAASGE
ncbi:MAG: ABC transporter ATP-binding protein [Deltaproteobacteria bacterium]|nr:ABC transporter ATP-binding protein [Deltaproteobacteria bacterium]